MYKFILLVSIFSSTAFAEVRYPVGLTHSSDGTITAVRGGSRDLKNDVIEVSGKVTATFQGADSQYHFIEHGKVEFISSDKLLITRFNHQLFAIANLKTKLIDCAVPMVGNNPGNAVVVSGRNLIAAATSTEVSLYDAKNCAKIATTTSLKDGAPYTAGWIQVLGADQSNFYFRAPQQVSGQWQSKLFTYSLVTNTLTSIDLAMKSGDFESAQLRPGTSEAWFFATGEKSQIKVFDVKSGQLVREKFDVLNTFYTQASDLQFSKDGSKYAIATGWNVGIFDTNDEAKSKQLFKVGCRILNPNFCTSWDGMAVSFSPIEQKFYFAGDSILAGIDL